MKPGCAIIGLIVALLGLVLLSSSLYILDPTEQAIITTFGKPVGEPKTEPGWYLKKPFLEQVNRLPKVVMEWDGRPVRVPTKEKTFIDVDTFGRWRISNPLTYFQRVRDERRAQSRLDDIIGSETRGAIAKHNLIEVIRSDKNRKPAVDESLSQATSGSPAVVGELPAIEYGRRVIEQEILAAAKVKVEQLGIELKDVRIKRVNYDDQVLERIYQRMISERQQISQRFRSEGEGEAAKINGRRERDVNEIESAAYKQVQQIRGEADARASEIYAQAYTQRPEAAEFYKFIKSLETFRKVLSTDSTLMLSTDSELFNLLKAKGSAKAPPPQP